MTRAEFFRRYPEFSQVDTSFVDSVLDECALELDPTTWGDKFDAGHGLYAADTLARSPMGNSARLVNENGTTTYGDRYAMLKKKVAAGIRST